MHQNQQTAMSLAIIEAARRAEQQKANSPPPIQQPPPTPSRPQFAGAPTAPSAKSMNELVWLWIRDHPGIGATQIAKALGKEPQKVFNALYDLNSRGMLRRTQQHQPGHRVPYYTYTTIGREWSLLPVLKDSTRAAYKKKSPTPPAVTNALPVQPAPQQTETTAMAPSPTATEPLVPTNEALNAPPAVTVSLKPLGVPTVIAALTLLECKTVYDYLHKLFKE